MQGMSHAHFLSQWLEKGVQLGRGAGAFKLHPHEEKAGGGVAELGCFFDIGPVVEQKTRNRMDDAGSIWAGQGQNMSCHGLILVREA